MSQHASLKGSGKITSKRNVLKRFERVNLLQQRGQWKERPTTVGRFFFVFLGVSGDGIRGSRA